MGDGRIEEPDEAPKSLFMALWDLVPDTIQTVLICCAYMSAGPGLIVLNSKILNQMNYPYPAAVSSLGLASSVVIVHASAALGFVQINRKITRPFLVKNVLPVGFLGSGAIVLGNIVYLHLSIAFIQMLKALTPVYILVCMILFKLESPSARIILAVLVISLGTSIASIGELRFSVFGFFVQSLADVVEGLKLVLQDVLLKRMSLSPMETLYFVAPSSVLFQFLYIAVMEPGALAPSAVRRLLHEHGGTVALVSIMGFLVNTLGFLVMKRTSGLVLKLLSILRSNGLVVASFVFVPGNEVTVTQWVGYGISMMGFMWYTRLKSQPQPKAEVPKAAQTEMDSKA